MGPFAADEDITPDADVVITSPDAATEDVLGKLKLSPVDAVFFSSPGFDVVARVPCNAVGAASVVVGACFESTNAGGANACVPVGA